MSNIKVLTTSSGNVEYCSRRNQFVVDNVLDGFDLYDLAKGKARWLRSFRTRRITVPLPMQVSFCEDGNVVVGGSDHGKIYVFDRRSGQKLDELPHEGGSMVQTISVRGIPRFLTKSDEPQARDTPGGSLVGAATSADHGKISISIWRRKKRTTGRRGERRWTIGKVLWAIMQTMMVIVTAILVSLTGCYSRLDHVCYDQSTRYASKAIHHR
jgi:WD40 repeat protein